MRRAVVLCLAAASLSAALAARAATFPNDPYFPEQWNLTKVGAPAAWTKATGAGITVGVVDTGVDLGHADLAGKVIASTNCVGAAGDPSLCHGSGQDDQGHGTHVSGIIAADTNNGIGVAGMAPDAHLVVAKALSSKGSGALDDVNAGIKWVVDHGARIVNLSIEADSGGLTVLPGESLADGVEYAYNHGAIAVVAAGNSTPSLFGGGAGYATVDAVIVGATGPNDEVAFYSSPIGAAKWGLVSPGGDAKGSDGRPSCAGALAAQCVVSTGWFPGHTNQYADDEGTSMAAPEVAGALALLMGKGSALGRDAAIGRILDSAAKISCGPGCHGRLDAASALQAVVAPPPTPSTTAPAAAPTTSPAAVAPAGSSRSGIAGAPRPVPPTSTTVVRGPTIGSVPVPTRPLSRAALPSPAHRGHDSGHAVAEGLAAALLAVIGLLVLGAVQDQRRRLLR
jgi:subtilisin family serine protease